MSTFIHNFSRLGLATAAWLTLALPALAQVKDHAGLFSPSTVDQANQAIVALKRTANFDFVVETFTTVPEGEADRFAKLDREQKNRFLSDWAVSRARAEKVHGVYVLITKKSDILPGHVEVKRDNKVNAIFPEPTRVRLRDEALIDHFKQGKFDEGLLAAVRLVRETVEKPHDPTREKGTDAIALVPSSERQGDGFLGLLCMALGAVGIVWVLVGVIRAVTAPRGASGGPGSPPGYAPGFGGGGFLSGLLGGMFGAVAGNYLYNTLFSGGHSQDYSSQASAFGASPSVDDYSGDGGDYDDSRRGDVYSDGGDYGGGDFGGDYGGGDFGGGDY